MPQVHGLIGDVALSLGKTDMAADAFREAARREPGNASLHLRLGDALRTLKRWNEASAAYTAASAAGADLEGRVPYLMLQQVSDTNAHLCREVMPSAPSVLAYRPMREAGRTAAMNKLKHFMGRKDGKIRVLLVLYDTVTDALQDAFDPERFEIDVMPRFFEDSLTLPPGVRYDLLISTHHYIGKDHSEPRRDCRRLQLLRACLGIRARWHKCTAFLPIGYVDERAS